MTPDEVSRMSQEKELVFVGGHRPIYGDKIRFYLEPYFKKRVQAPPPFSDTCTPVKTYDQLFAVHAADVADMKEKQRTVAEARAKADAQKKAVESKKEAPASKEPEVKDSAPEQAEPQATAEAQAEPAPQQETEKESEATIQQTVADAPSARMKKDLRRQQRMEAYQRQHDMEVHSAQPVRKAEEPTKPSTPPEASATDSADEQERFDKDVKEHAPKIGGLKPGYGKKEKKAKPDEPEKEAEEHRPDAEAPEPAAEGRTGEGTDSPEPAPEEGPRPTDEEALKPKDEEEPEPPAEDNHGLGDPLAEAEAEAKELDDVMANFKRQLHEKQKKEQEE